MAVSRMFFEQIEKFQCQKSSTTHVYNMEPTEDTWHVSPGHKRVFFVQNLQNPYMIDLGTPSPLICDACQFVVEGVPGQLGIPSKLFDGSAPM